MIAKFDCSSADAYANKTIGPGSSYTATLDAYFPSATLAALAGVTDTFAFFFGLRGATQHESIDGNNDPPWKFTTEQTALPDNGLVAADTWMSFQIDATYVSGTTWDFAVKANGTTIFTDSGADIGSDNTAALTLRVGGSSASNVPNEVYYIRDVSVVWS